MSHEILNGGLSSAKYKILIVEDERIVAEDLREQLEELGYEIVGITESGRKAIEIATDTKPDIVLMDVHIKADLNGVETAVCPQGLYYKPIPVVFITAYWANGYPLNAAVHPFVVIEKAIQN
jgi:CheY-like chemotaxis protein